MSPADILGRQSARAERGIADSCLACERAGVQCRTDSFDLKVLRLPDELARVDALLDDPVFFAPFVPFLDPRGRPCTAILAQVLPGFPSIVFKDGLQPPRCPRVARPVHESAMRVLGPCLPAPALRILAK